MSDLRVSHHLHLLSLPQLNSNPRSKNKIAVHSGVSFVYVKTDCLSSQMTLIGAFFILKSMSIIFLDMMRRVYSKFNKNIRVISPDVLVTDWFIGVHSISTMCITETDSIT